MVILRPRRFLARIESVVTFLGLWATSVDARRRVLRVGDVAFATREGVDADARLCADGGKLRRCHRGVGP